MWGGSIDDPGLYFRLLCCGESPCSNRFRLGLLVCMMSGRERVGW